MFDFFFTLLLKISVLNEFSVPENLFTKRKAFVNFVWIKAVLAIQLKLKTNSIQLLFKIQGYKSKFVPFKQSKFSLSPHNVCFVEKVFVGLH